jgi:hypothetical protein
MSNCHDAAYPSSANMRDCIYSAFAHALTVRIPDEDVTYFKTVGDAADYICAVDPCGRSLTPTPQLRRVQRQAERSQMKDQGQEPGVDRSRSFSNDSLV